MAPDVEEICESVRHGDVGRTKALLRRVYVHADVATFLEDVIGPVQRRVGELWEQGHIDARRASAASEMVRTALDDLTTDQGAGSRSRGRIGVACPRGESHDLPARIVSALLRNEGWDVTHLGPSVTIDALERYARTVQPVAIALSCTMPTRLMRAAETIQALHRVGLPVIAGGAAFGPTERRASTLGADGWCAHPSGVHRVLQASQRRSRDTDRHIAPNLGALLTDETRARIVDAALRSLARGSDRNPGLTLSDRTAGRVAALLSFAEAAVLTGDETVLTEAIDWWHQATRRGSSGAAFLTPGLDALSLAVEPGALHSMLRRGASRDCCPV